MYDSWSDDVWMDKAKGNEEWIPSQEEESDGESEEESDNEYFTGKDEVVILPSPTSFTTYKRNSHPNANLYVGKFVTHPDTGERCKIIAWEDALKGPRTKYFKAADRCSELSDIPNNGGYILLASEDESETVSEEIDDPDANEENDSNDSNKSSTITTSWEDIEHDMRIFYDRSVYKVKNDGNCQCRAIAHSLLGDQSLHKYVRGKIVQQLRKYPTHYQQHVANMTYETYVNKMKRLGTWGDHVTLKAAADFFGIQIFVVEGRNQFHTITPRIQGDEYPNIYLAYMPEEHYDSSISCIPQTSTIALTEADKCDVTAAQSIDTRECSMKENVSTSPTWHTSVDSSKTNVNMKRRPSSNIQRIRVKRRRRSGQGTGIIDGNPYVGNWKNGKASGEGNMTFNDNEIYFGQFQNNHRHGQGTYYYDDGSKYEGQWVQGKATGLALRSSEKQPAFH